MSVDIDGSKRVSSIEFVVYTLPYFRKSSSSFLAWPRPTPRGIHGGANQVSLYYLTSLPLPSSGLPQLNNPEKPICPNYAFWNQQPISYLCSQRVQESRKGELVSLMDLTASLIDIPWIGSRIFRRSTAILRSR